MLNQFMRYVPLSRLVREAADGPVLEVGSGPDGLAKYLPGVMVTGVDPKFAGERRGGPANLAPLAASALALPFGDGQFSVAVCGDTLEHLPAGDRETAVRELCRVASRKVFLSFPVRETHERWERRLDAAYRFLGVPRPDWLEEHRAFGLPSEAEVSAALRRSGLVFRVLPNENNLVHLLLMLAELTFLLPWLNFISDILAPDRWDPSGRSWKARLARPLLAPLRALPDLLTFGSPVRKIFIIEKGAPGA